MQIPKKDIEILLSLKNLKKQQTRNQISQLKLFYKFLDATQYNYRLFRRYLVDKDANADIKIRNLAKLSNLIFSIEENTRSREFKSFFYHLDSIPENKMEDAASFEEIDAVKLMTIHQAKGLEFPVVILAGVTSRRYNREQKEEESLIEIPAELMLDKYKFDRGEEIQRTFYVGLSRAEKILAISTIDGKRTKPSAFIEEIGKDKFINPEEFNENFSDDDHYQRSKEKTKLSYSSISAYINCPFRFFCRDCLGFQTPEDYFQEYGIILHNSLKKIHVLIKEGKAMNIEDIMSISDMYCKDDESKKKWRDELIMDLYNYYEKTQEFIGNILDVEIPFSYINKDVVVNGQADLIIKNKKGDIQIIDYKSRNIVGFEKINVDTQLRLYNIALQNKYDNQIKKIGAYTVKDNVLTWFNNDDKELENTKEIVANVSDSIDNKNFKRKWQGKTCSTQMGKCEFYYICNKLEEDAKNV
jgi:DNA helicase-2/ATP-dependent DNA helicase PcrA